MQMAQKQDFHARIQRVQAGGPNTFGTVYCGVQDVDTPKGKRVAGVLRAKTARRGCSARLMRNGLLKGLVQVAACGVIFALYLSQVGV